jgi:MFS family permease
LFHPKLISKYKIAWLLSYFSIASVSATIITPALPAIQLQFDLTPGTVDWVVSAFLMGYVFGQLLYGPLANRWGGLNSLRIGLVINLIGVLICLVGLSTDVYAVLIMGRILSALGAASGLVCGFMLINEWLPELQRKAAIAYSIFSFTLGIGLAVAIGGYVTEHWQWSDCFIVLLIHGFIMLLGTFVFHESNPHSKAINLYSIINGYKKALASQALVTFSLAVGFSTAITYCFSTAAPLIAFEFLHISAAEYGYWNLLNILGMLLGGLWSKQLMNKFSASKVVTLGLMLCVISLCSFLFMWKIQKISVLWFFGSSALLHVFGSLVFSGGSYIASNALKDKANSSSMMSFINMSIASLAVAIMPFLSTNPLLSFSAALTIFWLLTCGLLICYNAWV